MSANWAIEQLPGLSEQDADQLANAGIQTTHQLLQQGSTPAGRHQLAAQLQLHLKYVNKWVALADLARIPSVGCQYCGLLLHTGISSSSQLAQTSLDVLHRHILRFYVANLQRRDLCPLKEELTEWIQQAQRLTRSKNALLIKQNSVR
jgi:predicted flap endonuclease-1-like 5' DNA nuclease